MLNENLVITILNVWAKCKSFRKAEDWLKKAIQQGVTPTVEMFNIVISIPVDRHDPNFLRTKTRVRNLMDLMKKIGLKPDIVTYNTIISRLGKSTDQKDINEG